MVEITHIPAPGWPLPARSFSMVADEVIFLGSQTVGWLHIIRSDTAMARFRLTATANVSVEELDASGGYSITKDTASSTNIYYDAAGPSGAGYYIQHKPASTRGYRLYFMGSLTYPF